MNKNTNDVILYILNIAKANKLLAIKKTYLVKYVYYFDYLYAQEMGDKYTELDWKLHYYGPYSFKIDEILDKLVTSNKIRFSTYESIESESISYYLSEEQYPNLPKFNTNIQLGMEVLIKEHQKNQSLKSLLHQTYSTEPMQNKYFGDFLSFQGLEKVNFIKDIKPLRLTTQNEDKIKKIKSLLKKLSKESKDADKEPLFDVHQVPYSDFSFEEEESYVGNLDNLKISFSE